MQQITLPAISNCVKNPQKSEKLVKNIIQNKGAGLKLLEVGAPGIAALSSIALINSASETKAKQNETVNEPQVETEEMLLKKINDTNIYDEIDIESAAEELKMLTDNLAINTIKACAICSDEDFTINKKALLVLKYEYQYGPKNKPANLQKMAVASMGTDKEGKIYFDENDFYSKFDLCGRIKWSAALKDIPRIKSRINSIITDTVLATRENKKTECEAQFDNKEILSDLEAEKEEIINSINSMTTVPEKLKEILLKKVANNDFNIKQIYTDYYDELNNCTTLEDVHKLYPELEYPVIDKTLPKEKYVHFDYALIHDEPDTVIINALKDIHCKFTSIDKVYLKLINSPQALKAESFRKRYNNSLSLVPDEIRYLITKCDKYKQKVDYVSQVDDELINETAKRTAIRTSELWKGFINASTGYWGIAKLITSKRRYPEATKFQDSKLIDAYLFNLFLENPDYNETTNPFEQFDNDNKLTGNSHKALTDIYFQFRELPKVFNYFRYYDGKNLKEKFIKYNSQEFKDFKEKFDIDAMTESLHNMEENYYNAFFASFWTEDKVNKYREELEAAYNKIYRNINFSDIVKKVSLSNADAVAIIKDTPYNVGGEEEAPENL